MITYLLRDVEGELWAQFRERAARDGRTLRAALVGLIRYYVEHGMPHRGPRS